MFALFNLLISLGLSVIDLMFGLAGILGLIYGVAVIIPALAVAVRRLHDTDRSGWWLLIGFIPLIGLLVLLIFMILDSSPGRNTYGPNPKEIGLNG